jgi:hypothetical protein
LDAHPPIELPSGETCGFFGPVVGSSGDSLESKH